MGYDPTGHWDWGGFLFGAGLVLAGIATVTTFGAGGVLIGAAITATGAVMTYAAATDSVMVIDISVTTPSKYGGYIKEGSSVLIDFAEDEAYQYTHGGGGYGTGGGFTYSVGLVTNYKEPEDYSKYFVDISAGNNIGVDVCWNPHQAIEYATGAISLTFSKGTSFGIGYDYYGEPQLILEW